MDNPEISILITTPEKRESLLEMSLQSITGHPYDISKVELLIFLDYLDVTKAMSLIKNYVSFFNSIRFYQPIHKNQKVTHSATNRNYLALKARGKYLLFSEPEMFHIGRTLPLLLDFAHTKKINYWYCGPVYASSGVVNTRGDITIHEQRRNENISKLISLVKNYKNNFNSPQIGKYFHAINYKKFPSLFFCTMINRVFFFKIGALNQHLLVRGWEDIEFFERFRLNGGELYYDPTLITIHLPHDRTLSRFDTIGWDLYNSSVIFEKNQTIGIDENLVDEIRI
jgi:hypothetical protein